MARPTKYNQDYALQAYKLCLLGATDIELAGFFEVAESTINEWKLKHKEFSESLKKGKDFADAEIAHKLYQRASGYSHEHQEIMLAQKTGEPVVVDTVKHYPPDTTAAIFWLKNRQPQKWRDKNSLDVDLNRLSESDLDLIINKLILKNEKELPDPND